MTDASSLISDLQAHWSTLHDLDRAQAVKSIHHLGVSLYRLALLLNCSPSLLSQLLQAAQAPIEDCLLSRLGVLSTAALVRRAKAVGTRPTPRSHEEAAYEMERTAREDSQAILLWLADERVAVADLVQVIEKARTIVSMAERVGRIGQDSLDGFLFTNENVRFFWPAELELGNAHVLSGHALRLAAWAFLGISDAQVRRRAFELALDLLAGDSVAMRGMVRNMSEPPQQYRQRTG
jgi:hypothetical protein